MTAADNAKYSALPEQNPAYTPAVVFYENEKLPNCRDKLVVFYEK